MINLSLLVLITLSIDPIRSYDKNEESRRQSKTLAFKETRKDNGVDCNYYTISTIYSHNYPCGNNYKLKDSDCKKQTGIDFNKTDDFDFKNPFIYYQRTCCGKIYTSECIYDAEKLIEEYCSKGEFDYLNACILEDVKGCKDLQARGLISHCKNATLPLPEKCYSPDGRDCSWYRDCLEKKHPCAGQQTSYAIKFAEKFCLLYSDNYNLFSSQGQQWVDGVRRCLQVALVPMIRPYFKGSCEDIKREAFDSHAPCYVNPRFGAPSMCDLSCGDWLSVFWIIKSSFLTSDAFRTLKGMIEVGSKCKKKALSCVLLGVGAGAALATPYGRMAALLLLLTSDTPNRQKRDAELTGQVDRYELAAKITDFVAIQLKWNHDQLDWFGYTLDENIEAGENVSINIWLINKDKNAIDVLVGNEITRFENWITSGKNYLNVEVNGVQFKPVTLSLCENTNCESFNSTVIAGPPSNTNGMSTFASIWVTAISICIVIKYMFEPVY